MKSIIKLIIISVLLVNSVTGFSQTKTFTCDYTYRASEMDSEFTARQNAFTCVSNKLLREVGTYIRTEQQVVIKGDIQEYTEKIEAITAGIVKVEELDFNWNGKTYYILAKIEVDIKDVEQKIKEIADNKQKVKELEESRARTKAAEEEATRLKKELAELQKQNADANKIQNIENNYNKQINTLSAEEYFTKGNNEYNNENYKQSIEYYKQAININPNFVEAYSSIGSAYSRMKNYDQAIAFCNKAISLDPDNSDAYFTLGYVYSVFNLNDVERSLDYFVKAGKASKEYNVEMFCIEFGIELITTELNTVRVLCWLGQEDLLGQEDFDCNMIIPAFKQIIKIAPDHVEAYNSIAYAYKEIDDYKQAITYLKQAVSIDPNYANGYDSLGEMYYDIEDNEQAIKYFKKAISLNPDLAVSYYNLGNTYLRINDNKQAIENYRKAAQLEYADAQNWLRQNGIGW